MSEPITKELREYVDAVRAYHLTDVHGKKREYVDTTTRELLEIADRIDAEHERRVDDCRRETRRALVRYLRGVMTDYDRGIKRVRKGDATEVVRCEDCVRASRGKDGVLRCWLDATLTGDDDYCSWGERKEVDE